jgi:O-antigen ligase
MRLKSGGSNNDPGALIKRREPLLLRPASGDDQTHEVKPRKEATKIGNHPFAYAGVFFFTFLLYLRPNELFPVLGTLPVVKTVTIFVVLIYIVSKLGAGEKTNLSIEAKGMLSMALLALLFAPLAASPQDSINTLQEPFIKVVIIFILLINLLDTRQRLLSIWRMVVIWGGIFGLQAFDSYMKGEFTVKGQRIGGSVGGMFGNPNDLATSLDMLLPFAIVLFLMKKGPLRLIYLACAVVIAMGVVVTFSRGGFLGLLALSAVMLWKLGRSRRVTTIFAALAIVVVLSVAVPGGFGDRIGSVLDIDSDQTGSAQERWALMQHTANLALRNPVIGVGMGNIHIYSIRELVAHNAYLEVAAELGVLGLIAYLIVILAPMITLRRLERRTAKEPPGPGRDKFYMSIAIQAAIVAYMVCSFFSSIQYQWYVYYVAAYAVALRRIHAAEEVEGAVNIVPAESQVNVVQDVGKGGVLWNSARVRKGILANPAEGR